MAIELALERRGGRCSAPTPRCLPYCVFAPVPDRGSVVVVHTAAAASDDGVSGKELRMLLCPMNGMSPCRERECAWCMDVGEANQAIPVCAVPVLASIENQIANNTAGKKTGIAPVIMRSPTQTRRSKDRYWVETTTTIHSGPVSTTTIHSGRVS